MGTFLSERIVNYRCFIAGHGNRYSTLGASNNNRSTHTIDFHLSSHELLRIAIVAVLVYRVTTNIAAANGTGIIAGCNCDMGVLLSFSLTAVEGIDNITSLRLGRITNFVDAVFTKQLLATTVSKLPFAVAIPAGWNIRQRVRPTIEHRQPICAQALAYKVGTVIGCSISEDGVALRISAAFATAGRMIQRISDCSVGIVLDRNVGVGCSFNICLFLFAQFIVPYRPPVTVPKMRVIILSRPFLFWGIEKAELRKKLRLGYINRNDVQDYSLFVREHIV